MARGAVLALAGVRGQRSVSAKKSAVARTERRPTRLRQCDKLTGIILLVSTMEAPRRGNTPAGRRGSSSVPIRGKPVYRCLEQDWKLRAGECLNEAAAARQIHNRLQVVSKHYLTMQHVFTPPVRAA